MNGEIPSVPITTLAGVTSLTDLLPELPLPTPLPHNTNNKSLLFQYGLSEDAKRLLSTSDANVVSQLVASLSKTDTNNIELNDDLGSDIIDGNPPDLVRAILSRDPGVFHGKGNLNQNSALPNHNEHPSPHQAGPSPCTPGSPARVPPAAAPNLAGASSGFQAHFLNFASQNHVNHDISALGGRKGHSFGTNKPRHVTSPAQAAAAPNANAHDGIHTGRDKSVVVLEPIQMNAMLNPAAIQNISSHKKKKKSSEDDKGYNVVNQTESDGPKITLKIAKPKKEDRKAGGLAGSKRRRSEEERPEQNHDPPPNDTDVVMIGNEYAPSLGERVKRRRTKVKYNDHSDDEPDVIEIGDEVVMGSKGHRKGSKRKDRDDDFIPAGLDSNDSKSLTNDSKPDATKHSNKEDKGGGGMKLIKGPIVMLRDCMDYSPTQRKFLTLCDRVMESAEDADMMDLTADEDDAVGGSTAIVRHSTIVELCGEAAKLKSGGYMNLVPYGKLVKVLTILQYNIKDGCRPLPAMKEGGGPDDDLLRDIALEKMLSAVDASLVALYVMTSASMPKEVYLEDVIERLVRMTKVQLQHTVYPEFDPVYRVDPKNKSGYSGNFKAKRARSGGAKNRTILQLYNKLAEVISLLAELVEIQTLTDTIILQTSTLTVSPFFVENISELQLNSLKLVTNIFTRYEKHRQLIMEDILASLARLPTSKKNLRSYRLKNSEDHIQMVTALALQLIQSVVKLPSSIESGGSDTEAPKPADNMDSEVILVTSFENAMRTAHNFLAVFLKKCTTKGDEDYRPLFENFVYDLLATVNKPEWPAAELLLSLLGRLLVTQFSNKSVDMSLRVASLDYLGIVAARLRKDAVSSKLNETTIDEIIKQLKGELEQEAAASAQVKAEDGEDAEEKKEEETTKDEDGEKNTAAEQDEEDGDKKDEDNDVKKSKSKKKKKKKGRRRSRRISSDSSEDLEEEEEDEDTKAKPDTTVDDSKTQSLQQALLEYLVFNSQNDPALNFARQFYIGQWYRDCGLEVERATRALQKLQSDRNRNPDAVAKEFDRSKEIQMVAESRKSFLLSQINPKVGAFASFKPLCGRLDYENCCLVTRFLASSRPFSQSFEVYLTQILKVLCETAVAVRTRAMKCLSLVVEADPGILGRPDMERGVHARLLDNSTSVREAAVELVGKFLLSRPELINQYYDMLSARILDTGISVRKRVIKIFRDICVEQTEFDKIPEMCVKMIRRVNDEEGIKKLVNETFQTMWFTPCTHDSLHVRTSKLRMRVMNITDVVNACKETGYEWFEHLLENLLKKEEEAKDKPVETACSQLIDCLIEHVLKLETVAEGANGGTCSARLIACVSTLFLFCKVKPQLLVRHTTVLQPYLDIKCAAAGDHQVIHNVAKILELAVPLMEHPSENFLAQLEEDMMKLILKHGMMVLQSCVSCLGAIVNNVTHNYKLVRDCFGRFFGVLSRIQQAHKKQPTNPDLKSSLPTTLRSLFTLGLLCRHFDFDSDDFGEKKASVKDSVFDLLYYFISHQDAEVRHMALSGIGFFATRHYEFMMGKTLRDLYTELLQDSEAPVKMRIQVLSNLNHYLVEEEVRMMRAEDEWKKQNKAEDLKEMGDVQSGMASTIIQVYLKQLLESFFHNTAAVRMAALNVVVLVLRQGLVHPVQIVPYLIAMGADCDNLIRIKSDQQLAEIDKKYPGFIQMKAVQGVKMSYRLQEVLQQGKPGESIRGVRVEEGHPVALSSYIYSLIRSNRSQRRGLLTSMLNLFDDTAKTPLNELIYMADNLAAFPYQCQDEPLFIIHQVDILVSVSGSNVLQAYREIFFPESTDEETGKSKVEVDDLEEDFDALLEKVPEDVRPLQELYMLTQGCLLLLMLKQHMKDVFGFTEVKLQRYSPSDQAKMWDKSLTRKHGYEFDPKPVLEIAKKLPLPKELDEEGRKNLVQDYIDFKGLMMSIDPTEEDDDDDAPKPSAAFTPAPAGAAPGAAVNGPEREGKAVEGKPGEAGDAPGGRADNPEVIDLDDSGDKEELQAKSRQTPLTSSKSSYNKLLTLVTTSSSRKDTSSSSRHHGHHHKSSSSSSSRSRSHHQSSSSSHHQSSSRSSQHHHGGGSSSSSSKKKKKKKRRRYSESDVSESENSSDPDWA